jgi:prepilin-type processing-associated H-X9-DG protein
VDGFADKDVPRRIGNVRNTSRVVWLFDTRLKPAIGAWTFPHTNLHNRGAQFSFLDGHATRFRLAEYWDVIRDHGRNDNPKLVWQP